MCCSIIFPPSRSFQQLLSPVLCSTSHMTTSGISEALFTLMLEVRQWQNHRGKPYIWIIEISVENLRKVEALSHQLLLKVDHKPSPISYLTDVASRSTQLNTHATFRLSWMWQDCCTAEALGDTFLLTEVPELIVRNSFITCLLTPSWLAQDN